MNRRHPAGAADEFALAGAADPAIVVQKVQNPQQLIRLEEAGHGFGEIDRSLSDWPETERRRMQMAGAVRTDRPELIEVLHKTRQPFNVSGLAQAAALAGLEDDAHLRETKRMTVEGRAYLQKEFAALNLQFVPSLANFVLVNVGDGAKIFRALLEHRVIVRALKGYNLAPWVRISVGTMEQNRRCVAALKEILATRPA